MVTESTLYWMTRLDGIKRALDGLGFAAMTVAVMAIIILLGCALAVYDCETGSLSRRTWKIVLGTSISCFVFGLSLTLGNVFIPTTKEYAAIKAIPAIVNSEDAGKVADELREIAGLASEWAKENLKVEPEPGLILTAPSEGGE
jgi:hypothetical protein